MQAYHRRLAEERPVIAGCALLMAATGAAGLARFGADGGRDQRGGIGKRRGREPKTDGTGVCGRGASAVKLPEQGGRGVNSLPG